MPVLVEGGADNDAVDRVAIGAGLRQRFEQDHAGALAADEAVGVDVECLAAPVG